MSGTQQRASRPDAPGLNRLKRKVTGLAVDHAGSAPVGRNDAFPAARRADQRDDRTVPGTATSGSSSTIESTAMSPV